MSDLRLQLQSFTKNVCDGFVRFQQSGDFVDMTLAAEGHLVKVHKNILSVMSPYIEALLKSIPCKHPVIFLNNVTPQILEYILEYVYMGVVIVPKDKIYQFASVCKQLQIVGLMDYIDAMHDASVKLNKSNNHSSTRPSFNYDTESNRYEKINHTNNRNTDTILEEESPVPFSRTHLNKKLSNIDTNIANVVRKVIDDDINVIDLDRDVIYLDRNVNNMASDSENNLFMETKKRKSSSIYTDPSTTKQIKIFTDLSHKNTISDPVNDNSINNDADQPKYQIDLTNISILKDKSNSSDSKISNTVIFTPVNDPVGGGGTSIDDNRAISIVDDPTPSHSNINVLNSTTIKAQPMAKLMLNPVDGTISITRNNEIYTDTRKCKLVTSVVDEPMCHTDTSNDYDFTNLIQVNNNKNSVTINDLKEYSEHSHNATSNIVEGNAKNLAFDKDTRLVVPINQSSETIDTGESSVVTLVTHLDNYQDQFQKNLGRHNHSGHSSLEYRSKILEDAKPLYTLSNRGSLQMILNRFTYGMHNASAFMNKRRWRCIEYRDSHCPARVDTLDEDIIKRSFKHTHPFHDSKIIQKGKKDAVFAKMSQALKYANVLQKENPIIRNQEDYRRDLAMLIVKEDELKSMSKNKI